MPGVPQPANPNARGRNVRAISGNSTIPADEPIYGVPEPMGKLAQPGRQWWDWAWSLPIASQWRNADLAVITRRAELQDQWVATRSERLLSEMRQIEDRLGMSPRARAQLRWIESETREQAVDRAYEAFATEVIPERWRNMGTA
jgi:hypothetical protein